MRRKRLISLFLGAALCLVPLLMITAGWASTLSEVSVPVTVSIEAPIRPEPALVVQGNDIALTIHEPLGGDLVIKGDGAQITMETDLDGTLEIRGRNAVVAGSGAVEGDLVVAAAADAVVTGITAVAGDLRLVGEANLPDLQSVGGSLYAASDSALPALVEVGGEVTLAASLALESLEAAHGDLHVTAPYVQLPALASVGNRAVFEATVIGLNSLRKVGGDLVLAAPYMTFSDIHVHGTLRLDAGAGAIAFQDAVIAQLSDSNHPSVTDVLFADTAFENLYTSITGGGDVSDSLTSGEVFAVDAGTGWTFSSVRWPQDAAGEPLAFDLAIGSDAFSLIDTAVPGDLVVAGSDFRLEGVSESVRVAGDSHLTGDAERAVFENTVFGGSLDLAGAASGADAPTIQASTAEGSVSGVPSGTRFADVTFAGEGVGTTVRIEAGDVELLRPSAAGETVIRIEVPEQENVTVQGPARLRDTAVLSVGGDSAGRVSISDLSVHDDASIMLDGSPGSEIVLQDLTTTRDASVWMLGSGRTHLQDIQLGGPVVVNSPQTAAVLEKGVIDGHFAVYAGQVQVGRPGPKPTGQVVVSGDMVIESSNPVIFNHAVIESRKLAMGHTAADVRFNDVVFAAPHAQTLAVTGGPQSPRLILNNAEFRSQLDINGANGGSGQDLSLWLRGRIRGHHNLRLTALDGPSSQLGPNSVSERIVFNFDAGTMEASPGAVIRESVFAVPQTVTSKLEIVDSVFSAPTRVQGGAEFYGVTFRDDLQVASSDAVFEEVTVWAAAAQETEPVQLDLRFDDHFALGDITFIEGNRWSSIQLTIGEGSELALTGHFDWSQAPNLQMVQERHATINRQGTYQDPADEEEEPPIAYR